MGSKGNPHNGVLEYIFSGQRSLLHNHQKANIHHTAPVHIKPNVETSIEVRGAGTRFYGNLMVASLHLLPP